MYKKVILDGYIIGIGICNNGNIDESEYQELSQIFSTKPQAADGYVYRLRADTLEWELGEKPNEPSEPIPTVEDKAEAYDILLGEVE